MTTNNMDKRTLIRHTLEQFESYGCTFTDDVPQFIGKDWKGNKTGFVDAVDNDFRKRFKLGADDSVVYGYAQGVLSMYHTIFVGVAYDGFSRPMHPTTQLASTKSIYTVLGDAVMHDYTLDGDKYKHTKTEYPTLSDSSFKRRHVREQSERIDALEGDGNSKVSIVDDETKGSNYQNNAALVNVTDVVHDVAHTLATATILLDKWASGDYVAGETLTELRENLQHAELSEMQRNVIHMRYSLAQTRKATASFLGITITMVRKHEVRGVNKLGDVYDRLEQMELNGVPERIRQDKLLYAIYRDLYVLGKNRKTFSKEYGVPTRTLTRRLDEIKTII